LIGSDTVAAELTQELRMRDRYISGTRSPIETCGDAVIAARCRSLAGQIDANVLRSHGDLIPNP
jgi:hypothetical protein